jgi:hypothetical protein
LAVATMLAGCTIFVKTSDLDNGIAAPDAGRDGAASAGLDATLPLDAGVDACGPPSQSLVPLQPQWKLLGMAASGPRGVDLTTGAMNQFSAVIWNETTTFARFDMTATLTFGSPVDADGITFGWFKGADLPTLPMVAGGDLGVAGNAGFAVAIAYLQDAVGQKAPVVGLLDPSLASGDWWLAAKSVAGTAFVNTTKTLNVHFENGEVTVKLDDQVMVDRYLIKEYVAFLGHWGFTAASGEEVAAQSVTNVSFVDLDHPCGL